MTRSQEDFPAWMAIVDQICVKATGKTANEITPSISCEILFQHGLTPKAVATKFIRLTGKQV